MNRENIISSRQNPTVKATVGLAEKKHRRAEKLFRFDGHKLLAEAVKSGLKIEYLLVSEAASAEVLCTVENTPIEGERVYILTAELFERISEEKAPEGVIAVARVPERLHRELDKSKADVYTADSKEKLLLAESVRDPGNLGTLIRSCAALGIDRLIITDDCADLYNARTVRAAMGGLFRLEIDIVAQKALPLFIQALRAGGRRIYATALTQDAAPIGTLTLGAGDAFLIGNEGHGLSREAIEACDGCAIIPMSEGSESLNAAVAGAICIWETVRAK